MKIQPFKLSYDSDEVKSEGMEIESVSEETPIGEDSVISATFCNFLEGKMENVLD